MGFFPLVAEKTKKIWCKSEPKMQKDTHTHTLIKKAAKAAASNYQSSLACVGGRLVSRTVGHRLDGLAGNRRQAPLELTLRIWVRICSQVFSGLRGDGCLAVLHHDRNVRLLHKIESAHGNHPFLQPRSPVWARNASFLCRFCRKYENMRTMSNLFSPYIRLYRWKNPRVAGIF